MAGRALAIVLVAVAACSKGSDGPPVDAGPGPKPPAAHLESAKGDVKVERDGKLAPAQLGYLYVGDAVQTGEAGEAKVRFPGGRFVEVGPDARFVLAEGEGGLVLEVARGLVLTRVPNDAAAKAGERPVSLTILTPFGLTRVGTSEVAVDVGQDSASVDVKIGQIELVSRNGEVTKAAAGEKVALSNAPKPEKGPIVLPVVEVIINAPTAKAELKRKDAKAWTAVGKKSAPIQPGDAMRVKDGRASLTPAGSSTRLTLGKGAEIGFGGASRGGGVEETQLELRKGELSGALAAKQKTRVTLGGGLALVSEQGGQFTVTKTGSGFEVNALAGDFRLEREGGEAKVVPGGQSATVTAKDVDVRAPARDQLTLPSRMGMKVFHPGVGRLSLVWDGDENKAYRVEVASSPSYTDPLLAGAVHQRFVSVPVPARGNLYWRVFDGEKEVDRGSAYFAPEPRTGELDLRRNEVQDGADKTTIYYQDKPPAVTFTFAADAAAAKYKVAVFKEGALGSPLVERSVDKTQVVLDGALAEGKYLWSVTPLDAKGAGLKGGKMNKLEIVYDNAVPNLIIKAPRNGDPGGATVTVVGIAPVGAKVSVNGKALELDDKARFNATASPLPGGRLVFRMVGKTGAEVYTVRTVRR